MSTEIKYTPAPWNVSGESYGNYITVSAQPYFGSDKEMTVARVPWGKPDTDYDNYNAHLIAAAPTLLKALEEMISMIDDGVPESEWGGIKNRARKAIQKARGNT